MAWQEAHLGSRPCGARLVFRVPDAEGFVVHALLEFEKCRQPVALWQCDEISGRDTQEFLEIGGTYLLHIVVTYTSVEPLDLTLGFKLTDRGSTSALLHFRGKRGDVQRAIVFATVR